MTTMSKNDYSPVARYQQIINTPLPAFRGNIRNHPEYRKGWAREVKSLLKSLGLGWVSVTTPNYSMAESITIRFHQDTWQQHEPLHMKLEAIERAKNGPYCGMTQVCPYCKQEREAHEKLEAIILAAFPDLNDRSDHQTDYFDYCLSIE